MQTTEWRRVDYCGESNIYTYGPNKDYSNEDIFNVYDRWGGGRGQDY